MDFVKYKKPILAQQRGERFGGVWLFAIVQATPTPRNYFILLPYFATPYYKQYELYRHIITD